MGFKDVVNRVRSVFSREKHAVEQAVELSKGLSQPQGFDFSSLYGRYGMEPLLDYLRIEQELVSRFLDYNEMESLVIFEHINTPFGEMTIGEIIEKCENDPKFIPFVLSYDLKNKRIVVSRSFKPVKTGIKKAVYKVVLDTGRNLFLTAEHLCMLRNGEYRKVNALKPGDSLMPCKVKTRKGWWYVYQPDKTTPSGSRSISPVHRLLMEAIVGKELPENIDVHHINQKKKDNRPENLEQKLDVDHLREHGIEASKDPKLNADRAKSVSEVWNDREYKTRVSKKHFRLGKESFKQCKERQTSFEAKGLLSKSHRSRISAGRARKWDSILTKPILEKLLRMHGSINDLCKFLGTQQLVVDRRISQFRLSKAILGTLQPDQVFLSSVNSKVLGFEITKEVLLKKISEAASATEAVAKLGVTWKTYYRLLSKFGVSTSDLRGRSKVAKSQKISDIQYGATKSKVTRSVILDVFRKANGIVEAMHSLGVTRRTLNRLISDYGIDLDGFKPEWKRRWREGISATMRSLKSEVFNAKVVSVEFYGHEDTYDIPVPKYHNFGAEGVIVHNSYPELSAALDIWADESTQPDVLTGRTVWIESDDVAIKKLLQSLLDQTLQIDEDIWSIARNLCKYGNNYEEILVTPEGVVGLNPLPPETVRRFEREKGLLIGFAQDVSGRFGVAADDVDKALRGDSAPPPGIAVFEPWQMAHFRLMGRSRPSTYGISILEPARWLWRRLLLLEDAALIYRLTRTPTRWIFYIDVGKLPPTQALGQIRKIKQEFTKNKFVNERGGVDLRYSPLASDENLFIPVVDGKRTTEVDLMATPEWQVMDDINYFKDKLFSAIKIPKAYLSEESDQRSRVLSLLDIRFARGVMRVQRELKNGIKKVCKVHLAAIGIDPEKVSFDVFLTVPSWAYELAQIEVRNAKAEFADKVSTYLPERAIIKLIFGFSDEEIDALRKEKAEEEAGAGGGEEGGGEAGGAEPERKKPDQRKTGGSPIDLPGVARVAGRETEDKAYKMLVEQMEKLTKSNSKLAKKFEELKSFSHELRSSMFFKGSHGSKTRAVPSFGNGGGRVNPE